MTDLERMARGVIMVGFDATALRGELRDALARDRFAGYVLFARNVRDVGQVRALTDELRALHDEPPMIAVDQEGGRVMRMRTGVEVIPPMMALGAANRLALTERAGEQIAFDLRRAGCTIDFAPVLDLALDSRNTVIGTRAFSSDPERVAAHGERLAAGLERGGIVATFKHFPGHGSTAFDSHVELPVVELDATVIRTRDLVPFERCLPAASAVMTAHIVVHGFDSAPATLSHVVLTDMLRTDFEFNGVCFTDCMQMDAIAAGIGTADGVSAAIAAGADCALVSHDPELARVAAEALAQRVRNGTLPYERLAEAYARVAALRERSAPPIDVNASPPHPGVGREIARNAIVLVRGTAHADPVAAIAVSFEGTTVEGVQGRHEEHPSLQREAPALEMRTVSLDPDGAERDALLEDIARSGRRPIVLMRRAHIYRAQLAAVHALIERFPDAMVVSLREPYDCALVPQARHLLAAFGDDVACIGALADVLFGNVPPGGTMPVPLDA